MPLYEYHCVEGHKTVIYQDNYKNLGSSTIICSQCESTMGSIIKGVSKTWAYPVMIHNLGISPVMVESASHHKKLMKEAGVCEAGSRMGEKGVWV